MANSHPHPTAPDVVERPSVSSIEIEGNKAISTEDLMKGLKQSGLAEGEIFQRATLEGVRNDMRAVSKKLATQLRPEEQALFDVYLMMLEDVALGGEVVEVIKTGQWAQGALRQVVTEHVSRFELMDDAYLRERASDVRDLGRRLLAYLQEERKQSLVYPDNSILVSEELSPAMLGQVPEGKLVGLVSVQGSGNSHVAILARAMGIPLSEMPLWDPYKAQGGATDPSDYAKAKMILWKGFCSVHQRFTVEQIEKARAAFPGVKVIVHPECSMQVVDAADGTGSTAYIVKEIANAPAGSAIAVGTEINLVNRLAAQYPDKTVFCLDPVVCPCSTMYRIHPAYLAWALENIEQGNIVNRITVDDATARDAKIALQRMLEVHP